MGYNSNINCSKCMTIMKKCHLFFLFLSCWMLPFPVSVRSTTVRVGMTLRREYEFSWCRITEIRRRGRGNTRYCTAGRQIDFGSQCTRDTRTEHLYQVKDTRQNINSTTTDQMNFRYDINKGPLVLYRIYK